MTNTNYSIGFIYGHIIKETTKAYFVEMCEIGARSKMGKVRLNKYTVNKTWVPKSQVLFIECRKDSKGNSNFEEENEVLIQVPDWLARAKNSWLVGIGIDHIHRIQEFWSLNSK